LSSLSASSCAASRGGRKLIIAPDGSPAAAAEPKRDDALIKVLVKAHRWRRRIESGRAKSIADLAAQKGVTDAYVCRVLPLSCLAPDINESILDGRQPDGLTVAVSLRGVTTSWEDQRRTWGLALNQTLPVPMS
jgi:hypothetical protein